MTLAQFSIGVNFFSICCNASFSPLNCVCMGGARGGSAFCLCVSLKNYVVIISINISFYDFSLLFNLERPSHVYPCFLLILLVDFHCFINILILNIFKQTVKLKAFYSKHL